MGLWGEHAMRVLIIILFSLHILYAQEINEKMIISAHIETEKAAQSLYEVEKFFQENDVANSLKIKHHLSLGMELLDPYVIVTLKPIRRTSVKNQLRYVLQSKFPQNFIVDNTQMQTDPTAIIHKTKPITQTAVNQKKVKEVDLPEIKKPTEKASIDRYAGVKQFWHELDNEWLGLIFLALAGFILVYRSARQMSKIKALQEEVNKYQTKIETEVDYMGEKHA